VADELSVRTALLVGLQRFLDPQPSTGLGEAATVNLEAGSS